MFGLGTLHNDVDSTEIAQIMVDVKNMADSVDVYKLCHITQIFMQHGGAISTFVVCGLWGP